MKSQPKAVFLHTGYRTAGTWLWSCFRSLDQVTGYYEPLHEMLAKIDPTALAKSTADSWRSGHPTLEAPYFAEFAHLLRDDAPGIDGFDERFSIDSLNGKTPESADRLAAYVNHLTRTANEAGRVPVFKFCRSLGRLHWFHSTFPDAVHIVVMKNPISQWQSCWELLAKHDNAHFVAIPFAVLDMNRNAPMVKRVLEALHVELPDASRTFKDTTLDQCVDFYKQHVKTIAPETAYRAFLAHWLLTLQHATAHSDAIFDCDLAARSSAYAEAAEHWIAKMSGLEPSFGSMRQTSSKQRDCGFNAAQGLDIHLQAFDLAKALTADGAIDNGTLSLWASKLAQATQVLAFGPDVNWPQANAPMHRATRVVDIALIDGIGMDGAMISELAATRTALNDARSQLAKFKRAPLSRLKKKVRKLFTAKENRAA
ncbi:hypothetical protein [Paraburkholderia sp.]|uniref:hypothetical protein n=1 Tax=Paraburkholderia sp. TaxID=1926495 RepID=UPI0023895963|nr:hypothetical protein [Paraburkholderia sp.]MDE1179041.1 hypothetical protein [Paraburkholderia sp.]